MSLARATQILCAALLVSACTEVRSGQVASLEEREAASDLIAQLSALASQPLDSESIVQAASVTSLVTLLAPAGTPLPAAAAGLLPDPAAGPENSLERCVIATETSVTYSECELAAHVVDGTWSVQRNRVHAQLVDVFVTGPGVHGSVAIDANMAAGNELGGAVDASVMWTTGDVEHTLDATIRIDNLLLDGARCATGGTITLIGSLGDAPASTVTLWLGPGCQDVQIAR